MKFKKISIYFSIIALGVLLSQCTKEGPMGPAGADGTDGTDGVDGNITCLACHSTAVKEAIDFQFQQSVHSSGAIAVDYAGGRASCASCHSHEGFVEYAATGTVGEDISSPGAWECATCHNIHDTFEAGDYAFRLADPVTMIFDGATSIDMGNSNLCINCHQSRRSGPYDMVGEWVDANGIEDDGPGGVGDDDEYEMQAGEFFISSTHYGPHHGAQANIMYGIGFAEITGSLSYPTAGTSSHMSQVGGCTGCHMDDYADGQGGHTFNPSLNSCNNCHSSTSTNFDYGGGQTEAHDLLVELRDLLLADNVIEGDDVDGYHPVVGVYTVVQAQAFFNWVGLEEDRSLGAHNPQYTKALLQNSIDAL